MKRLKVGKVHHFKRNILHQNGSKGLAKDSLKSSPSIDADARKAFTEKLARKSLCKSAEKPGRTFLAAKDMPAKDQIVFDKRALKVSCFSDSSKGVKSPVKRYIKSQKRICRKVAFEKLCIQKYRHFI